MSQYGESNPHFWPRPEFQVPQHIDPEPVQLWENHPDPNPHYPHQNSRPDKIQTRPRQPRGPLPYAHNSDPNPHYADAPQPDRMQRRPRTPLVVGPPRSPSSTPRHHQQDSGPRPHPVEVPASRRHQPSAAVDPDIPNKAQSQSQHQPKPAMNTAHPHHVSFENRGPHHHQNLMYPSPSRTKPITWFGAVFCVILWLVIILGGLLVLIIYLVYRPRTPHFEISSATLNAAYLDMGYLLNSDLTVLANFTNPNKKVNVDFSYVILQLYFDKHLIANQYIEPFSAVNTESKLANVEMISSQVRLPMRVTQQLVTQIQRNRIQFEVDGIFHARSNFGSLLRYSYWLYGHCIIEMTGPPSGIILASKCRTKD